ncbi:hypothetical protein TVAG_186440 [Trichomonas vaginalis G3]|uniref:Uncharacterized protein n=1 Tax=Trichomonas vaginalis (strain ATCC PRA-98 / G3) TaxID=412133 RepID=A2D8T7_TRIV3|nr:spectrin binding [Trichomonas vaginalis G3]EAY23336.1 hypothetical protein TVAG_186440 [Trichomonas vaginalis G3]KAI5533797.1 spectrin binding [Trichomonas vaginalis G3]|eukprot:XP_001584322.1 hypothetical protein [Trichomonas vaginalis G3]
MVLIQLDNQILYRINNYNSQDKVILAVNNVEILLNKSFAVAISQKIFSQYLLDNGITKIDVNTEIISPDTYNVLKDILQYRQTEVECDDTILKDLFHIGMNLGINELTNFYKSQVLDKMQIDKNNCIELLEFYLYVSSKDKILECIDFISAHFFEIDKNKLKLASNKLGLDILQRILSRKELVIENEDSLANFIISLANENETFYPLYENIYLEFCSKNIIDEIEASTNANNYKNVVKSLHDSLLRTRNFLPIKTISQIETNYFQSGNVEMSASSYEDGSADLINRYKKETFVKTKDYSNSWIQWKLKSGFAIQPNEYIIRSVSDYGSFVSFLQSWKVEGTTIRGEKIILHEMQNSAFKQGDIRKYSINTSDLFVSFKIIQTGKNCNGNDQLLCDVFDFSGSIYSFNSIWEMEH